MKKLYRRLKQQFGILADGIAFYPTLITLGFAFLAVVIIIVERKGGLGEWLSENIPILLIENIHTARAILNIITGGMISLIVFSFSMVMLLLNQASSNFSPRVLPGLISNKRHQFVLGVFLGTIIFSLIVYLNLAPNYSSDIMLGFSSFLALQLGIFSLGVFIYFLDSISREVQIGHILHSLYNETYSQLKKEFNQKHSQRISKEVDTSSWHIISSNTTGYLQSISESGLLNVSQRAETALNVLHPKGTFIITGMPLIQSREPLKDEQAEEALKQFYFDTRELIGHNYNYGFKQITEIVVKAMSPGINDPGTALMGIDFLSDLFRLRFRLPDYELIRNGNGSAFVYIPDQTFHGVLYTSLASIRQYVKHDVQVGEKLIKLFEVLLRDSDPDSSRREILRKELKTLWMDLMNNVANERDREFLVSCVSAIEAKQEIGLDLQTKDLS